MPKSKRNRSIKSLWKVRPWEVRGIIHKTRGNQNKTWSLNHSKTTCQATSRSILNTRRFLKNLLLKPIKLNQKLVKLISCLPFNKVHLSSTQCPGSCPRSQRAKSLDTKALILNNQRKVKIKFRFSTAELSLQANWSSSGGSISDKLITFEAQFNRII